MGAAVRCHFMLNGKVEPKAIAGGLLAAIGIAGLLLTDLWALWLIPLAAAAVLLAVTVTDRYEYECQRCHARYRLGAKGILASRHGRDANGSWAISRCPHCGAVTKAREARSHDQEKG